MGELFDDLVGFLMHEEEEVVQKNIEAEILAIEEGNDDDMIMPTGIASSFNNGTDDCQDQLDEADWYNQYSDLHYPDHLGEQLVMYDTNHLSDDIRPDNLLIEANGSFHENDGLIDQYIHDETTWPLQQQAADNNCQDGHQPQSSTSSLPNQLIDANGSFRENEVLMDLYIHGETTWPLQQLAVDDNYQDGHQPQYSTSSLPGVVQVQEIQERPPELLKLVREPVVKQSKRRKKGKQVLLVNHGEEEGDDALGAAEAGGFLEDLVIDNDGDHDEEFLMRGEEAVQTSNAAETLASEGNDDHMMPPTETIRSFSNGTDYYVQLEEEADWHNQFSDLHLLDHHQNHLREDLIIYDNNHPSSDIQPNNLSLDVNGYFQENDGLIDQYIDDEMTWPLQQKLPDQPHSSISFIPVVPYVEDNVLIDIDNNDELLINNPHNSTSKQQLQVQEPQERSSKLVQLVEPIVKRTKRRKKGKPVLAVNHGEEEEDDVLGAAEADGFLKDLVIDNDYDDGEDNIGDDNQLLSVASKNLMSERIRRKRLNKQLLTLRGMVPNITKMDKRSVLVDALAYLQDILHQTKIAMENEKNNISSTAEAATEDPSHAMVESSASPDSAPVDVEINHPPCHHLGVVSDKKVVSDNVDGQPQPIEMLTVPVSSRSPHSAIFPAITQVEAEKLDKERYLLKVVYNKAPRAMAQVQRSVEMLNGIQFIDVSVSEYDQQHMQSSTFLRVKKAKGSVLVTDAENLVEKVKTMAKQLGVRLSCAASSAADD